MGAENSPKDAHGPMDVRLDGPDRLVQYLRNLGMTTAFDEPERCRGSQMHGQLQEGLLDQHHIRAALDDRLGLLGSFLRVIE